jgi:hypothetical protein
MGHGCDGVPEEYPLSTQHGLNLLVFLLAYNISSRSIPLRIKASRFIRQIIPQFTNAKIYYT